MGTDQHVDREFRLLGCPCNHAFQHQQLAALARVCVAVHRIWGIVRDASVSLLSGSLSLAAPADQVAHLWVRARAPDTRPGQTRRDAVSRSR